MFIIWLIVLLIYGTIVGLANVPAIGWLLLIPMMFQDWYDVEE